MKRDRDVKSECPKCRKKDSWVLGKIYTSDIPHLAISFIPENKKKLIHSPRVYSYVCKSCGYVESYVNPKELKKKLKK